MSAPAPRPETVRVWDRVVRGTHWALAGTLALSALSLLGWGSDLHQGAGWAALAIVGLRLLWPLLGGLAPPYARLRSFVRGPRATGAYAKALAAGQAPRHLGHNPLGAWMILALWATVAALAFSGWLYTTDAFFGDETVELVHEALAWALLVLVLVHWAGVAITSRRQRENLVAAMVTGRKRAPATGDIE